MGGNNDRSSILSFFASGLIDLHKKRRIFLTNDLVDGCQPVLCGLDVATQGLILVLDDFLELFVALLVEV